MILRDEIRLDVVSERDGASADRVRCHARMVGVQRDKGSGAVTRIVLCSVLRGLGGGI